ncbi:tRNA preQ1(34) S-adenosylmethionine ribosyltransferase-isomerase QueA [Desulforhopalus singaporensis]|uniref:S-adenosylmethionine:tRNA ribosyltransferase-isomerase n=1 Tax=Desulforhopalus singaporensis TaxID=91360 RepID=A0A1H0TGC5_9BACT|nr:tRNA preQ1(34) S-adenosylmethionine ribosyltransferase-isomerase QueA [Desulforhopalus singaporensis]SDP52895.1 S-adenosylmethionine--tRNA ribosyltransferase-isomerase [Desulforhopalus singaporensis]
MIPQEDLTLEAYRYHLPKNCIAQHPADRRDTSRLMVLDSGSDSLSHRHFNNLDEYIGPCDMLVVNNTKVFPARLEGVKETGGKAEVFLLELPSEDDCDIGTATATALIKSSKRPKPGSVITIGDNLHCVVSELLEDGKAALELHYNRSHTLAACLLECGQVPLPPYIVRKNGSTKEDAARYQTVYAAQPGAVAAPTAGLHFTDSLLSRITDKGTLLGEVTLHVGYGTFAPVRDNDITQHKIHREFLSIPEETVAKVEKTRERGGKIWAVGTTSVRALEYGALKTGRLQATEEWCDLYIYPGFKFQVTDNLITNFHLPDSSLMFLVSALCGRKTLLNCYKKAIEKGYRFFSYGDAMAIIGDHPRV